MSPVKANTPAAKVKTPSKSKAPMFTPPKTRRRSMKPPTPKSTTPEDIKKTPQQKKTPAPAAKEIQQTPKQATLKGKTPQKGKKKTNVTQSPKPTSPAQAAQKKAPTPVLKQQKVVTPAEREAADLKTLFMKGLPEDCTEDTLRALSPAVVDVRLRRAKWQKKGSNLFAFVEFKTEDAANKHFETIKKVNGKSVCVDFVGSKAKTDTKRKRSAEKVAAPTKVYLTGLRFNEKDVSDLKKLLSKCTEIDVPMAVGSTSKPRGYAFAHFKTASEAKNAMDSHQNAVVNGQKLILRPAQLKKVEKQNGEQPNKKTKATDGKKTQLVKKEKAEEGEEDDEIDDDEDELDDDDVDEDDLDDDDLDDGESEEMDDDDDE